MKIICLFVQRVEGYPGQLAPELFAAVDEATNSDNPEYLCNEIQQLNELQACNEVDFWRRIEIKIDDEAFREQFKPDPPPLTGAILEQT